MHLHCTVSQYITQMCSSHFLILFLCVFLFFLLFLSHVGLLFSFLSASSLKLAVREREQSRGKGHGALLLNLRLEDSVCFINDWSSRKRRKSFYCLCCVFVCLSPGYTLVALTYKENSQTTYWISVCLRILEAASQIASGCVNRHVIYLSYYLAAVRLPSFGCHFSPFLPDCCSNK